VITAKDLQSDLEDAECIVARIRSGLRADDVLYLFWILDRFEANHRALAATGIDLDPALTRIKAVYCALLDHESRIVRTLGRRSLCRFRTQTNAPAYHWWWHLDRRIADRRRRQLGRLARALGIAVAILAVVTVVYFVGLDTLHLG
jgi:hypothetical protein